MNEHIEGKELDAAVARALGIECCLRDGAAMCYDVKFDTGSPETEDGDIFEPSRKWAHGGPIIESEGIEIWRWSGQDGVYWVANVGGRKIGVETHATGATPLVAAMRAFVRSKANKEIGTVNTIDKLSQEDTALFKHFDSSLDGMTDCVYFKIENFEILTNKQLGSLIKVHEEKYKLDNSIEDIYASFEGVDKTGIFKLHIPVPKSLKEQRSKELLDRFKISEIK